MFGRPRYGWTRVGVAFGVTFACSPAGHVTTEDKNVVKVTEAEFPPR
jgi:hypothetical protein